MPVNTVPSPVPAIAVDRLTLQTTGARDAGKSGEAASTTSATCAIFGACGCFSDE